MAHVAAVVALIAVNPFCYAFERMSLLEPLLVARYEVFDDPNRDILVLYKLEPLQP